MPSASIAVFRAASSSGSAVRQFIPSTPSSAGLPTSTPAVWLSALVAYSGVSMYSATVRSMQHRQRYVDDPVDQVGDGVADSGQGESSAAVPDQDHRSVRGGLAHDAGHVLDGVRERDAGQRRRCSGRRGEVLRCLVETGNAAPKP